MGPGDRARGSHVGLAPLRRLEFGPGHRTQPAAYQAQGRPSQPPDASRSRPVQGKERGGASPAKGKNLKSSRRSAPSSGSTRSQHAQAKPNSNQNLQGRGVHDRLPCSAQTPLAGDFVGPAGHAAGLLACQEGFGHLVETALAREFGELHGLMPSVRAGGDPRPWKQGSAFPKWCLLDPGSHRAIASEPAGCAAPSAKKAGAGRNLPASWWRRPMRERQAIWRNAWPWALWVRRNALLCGWEAP